MADDDGTIALATTDFLTAEPNCDTGGFPVVGVADFLITTAAGEPNCDTGGLMADDGAADVRTRFDGDSLTATAAAGDATTCSCDCCVSSTSAVKSNCLRTDGDAFTADGCRVGVRVLTPLVTTTTGVATFTGGPAANIGKSAKSSNTGAGGWAIDTRR